MILVKVKKKASYSIFECGIAIISSHISIRNNRSWYSMSINQQDPKENNHTLVYILSVDVKFVTLMTYVNKYSMYHIHIFIYFHLVISVYIIIIKTL